MKIKLEFAEDDAQNPSIFLINPWNGKREKIAILFWPTHDPEFTGECEALMQNIGERFAECGDL